MEKDNTVTAKRGSKTDSAAAKNEILSARKTKLYLKFAYIFLTMGILIYLTTAAIGAVRFSFSIIDYYEMEAYDAAVTAAGYFTREDLDSWILTLNEYNNGNANADALVSVSNSESYRNALTLIKKLREKINANDISVFIVDENALNMYDKSAFDSSDLNLLRYVFNSCTEDFESSSFGDPGSVLPSYIPVMKELLNSGARSDKHILYRSPSGYNIVAIHPITKSDHPIAMSAVDIPMTNLMSDIVSFAIRTFLGALLVTFLLISVGTNLVIKMIIRPVSIISNEAQVFVENENKISDRLSRIRTGDEIETLSRSLLKMQIGINEYIRDLTAITAEKERIGTELNVATKIQADMLPRIFPPFPDKKEFDLYAIMDPAKEVGGDFYDFFMIDDDHLGLVIADVSGKGVPAALFMVITKTLIKNRALVGGSPSEILTYANNQLCEGNDQDLFVTVWLGILEISTGRGIASNAGHEHPVIMRAGGDFELEIYRHSLALAVMEDVPFEEHEFKLNKGDTLMVYTDGVPEATNADGVQYGTDSMLALLNNNKDVTLDKLLANLRSDMDRFVGDAPQFDDVTMLAIRYNGE